MKFRMAFGIFDAEVEIPGVEYDGDTDEFKNTVVERLEKGGIKVIEVEAT
ncbi:MAG: hypothetical protein Q8J68_08070 [Methanolobus sp.]|nr:hypothetical protein [Methanolobus sp.]MDP2217225.1 hypothetical protein [Methanolobus sp.]